MSSSQADALLVLTVLFLPVYIALIQGQLSIVVLLLFTLFVTEARGEWAGLWAGLLLIKPQLAFIPFLTLLLNRNWRGLAVGLATGLAQAVVSLALVGLPGLYDNLAVLRKMSTDNAVLAWLPRMHNLRQVSAFLGTGEAGYFVLAGIAVVVFSIAWLLNRDSSWSRIALVLVASLASPHLFLHDLTILLIPVAIFVGMQRQDFRYRHQLISAGSGLLSLLALYRYPIMSGLMLAGFMFGSSRLFSGSPSKQAGHSQVRRTGNEQAGCLRSPAEVPPSGH